jgi:hypothetical protein
MKKLILLKLGILFSLGLFAQGITGTFFIGPEEDYETIQEAIQDLQENGVTDEGATFLVQPGTYVGPFVFENIEGTSSTSRLIFQAADASDFPLLVAEGTSANNDAVVRVNNMNYLTLYGFRIEDISQNAATGVEYGLFVNGTSTGGNQFNEFRNLHIYLGASGQSPSQSTRGVFMTSQAPANSPQFANHNNVFDSLLIDNASWGMQLRGNFGLFTGVPIQVDTNNVVSNSVFGSLRRLGHELNFGALAINGSSQKNLTIHNNIIDSVKVKGASPALPVTVSGISFDNCSGEVSNNQIRYIEYDGNPGTPMGMRLAVIGGEELIVKNNTISNVIKSEFTASTNDPSLSTMGIWIFRQGPDAGLAKIYHNSIYLNRIDPVSFSSAGIQLRGGTTGQFPADVYNNIIVNNISTTSDAYFAAAIGDGNTTRGFLNSDNNVLEASGINGVIGVIGNELGGTIQFGVDLEDFQVVSETNENSAETIVNFIDGPAGFLDIDLDNNELLLFSVPTLEVVPLDLYFEMRDPDLTAAGAIDFPIPTGIREEFTNLKTFRAYPNPFRAEINIEMDLDYTLFSSLRIVDISGKVVYSEAVSSLPNGFYRKVLNLDFLQPGVYLVQIMVSTGEPAETIKIIKK